MINYWCNGFKKSTILKILAGDIKLDLLEKQKLLQDHKYMDI